MKKIKLMADYGCYPLWGTTPEDFGDISPSELPISAGLQDSLLCWAARYDATLNIEDPLCSGFKDKQEEEIFIKDGDELSQRLRDELGSEFDVIYQTC